MMMLMIDDEVKNKNKLVLIEKIGDFACNICEEYAIDIGIDIDVGYSIDIDIDLYWYC